MFVHQDSVATFHTGHVTALIAHFNVIGPTHGAHEVSNKFGYKLNYFHFFLRGIFFLQLALVGFRVILVHRNADWLAIGGHAEEPAVSIILRVVFVDNRSRDPKIASIILFEISISLESILFEARVKILAQSIPIRI